MDFAAAFQTWMNVLTNPGEEVFEQERQSSNANLVTALIWIVIAAFVLAFFSVISTVVSSFVGGGTSMMTMMIEQMDLPPDLRNQMMQQMAMSGGLGVMAIGVTFCYALIFAPLGFLISSGIYFLLAKLFGGTGNFEMQSYLLATFMAPLYMVTAVVSVIPCLGGLLSLVISIYQLVLSYFAIKVCHNISSGAAAGVVLIPVAVFLLCICGVIMVSFGAIFAAAGAAPQ